MRRSSPTYGRSKASTVGRTAARSWLPFGAEDGRRSVASSWGEERTTRRCASGWRLPPESPDSSGSQSDAPIFGSPSCDGGTRRLRVRRRSPILRDGTGNVLRYSRRPHREEGSVPCGSNRRQNFGETIGYLTPERPLLGWPA